MKRFFIVRDVKHVIFLFHTLSLLLICQACNKSQDRIIIVFTGDMLLDRGVRNEINKYGISSLFSAVKTHFREVDFVISNLECPATTKQFPLSKKYVFRAEPQWLKDVKSSGISHLILSNNHSVDQGRIGLEDTYQNILRAGLIPIGYGFTHKEACQPVLLTKNSLKVAIFSSVLLPIEGWNYLPEQNSICQASPTEIIANIKEFKNSNPDIKIVIVLHWGVEFSETPTISQRKYAHDFIDAGADIIVGHHPHVIQETEQYKKGVIFYSIGNFIFDQKNPSCNIGQLAELHITKTDIFFEIKKINIQNCKPIIY